MVCITSIRYADDTAVVASSNADLQRMMEKIQETYEEYGMGLNPRKAVIMKIKNKAKEVPLPLIIKVNGKTLQQVTEYVFLESMIYDDMRSSGDVKKRNGMGKMGFGNAKSY